MQERKSSQIRDPGYYIYQQDGQTVIYSVDKLSVMQMGDAFIADLNSEDFPGEFFGPLNLEELICRTQAR